MFLVSALLSSPVAGVVYRTPVGAAAARQHTTLDSLYRLAGDQPQTYPISSSVGSRYERGSTIVTSDLPFEERPLVFRNECLTGALLDRLSSR